LNLKWQKVKLGDISEMQYGFGSPAKETKVGPKFLRITDIVPELIDWEMYDVSVVCTGSEFGKTIGTLNIDGTVEVGVNIDQELAKQKISQILST